MNLREVLTPLTAKAFDIPESSVTDIEIIEYVTEERVVWNDSEVDTHRWYNRCDVVVQCENLYVRYCAYQMTGDNGMDDQDLSYNLDEDFWIVNKREAVETVIYYD